MDCCLHGRFIGDIYPENFHLHVGGKIAKFIAGFFKQWKIQV